LVALTLISIGFLSLSEPALAHTPSVQCSWAAQILGRLPLFKNEKFRTAWRSEYQNAHTFRKALLLGRVFSLARISNNLCKKNPECNVESLRQLLLSETRRSQRMIDSVTAPSIAFAAALGTMATFKPDLLTTTRGWIWGFTVATATVLYRMSVGRHAKETSEERWLQGAYAGFATFDPRNVLPGTRGALTEFANGAMTKSDRGLDFAISRVTDSILKPVSIEALQKIKDKKLDDAAIHLADGFLRILTINPEFFLLLAVPPQKDPDRVVTSILARFWIDFLKPLREDLEKSPSNEQTYEKVIGDLKEKTFTALKLFLKSSTAPATGHHHGDHWDTPLTAVLDHAEDRYNEAEFDRVAKFVIHRLFDYQGLFQEKK